MPDEKVITEHTDTAANGDPLRTLKVTQREDGVLYFEVDFKAPGSFVGHFNPFEPGVIAYVFPTSPEDLTDDTDCVACFDTYEAGAK